MIPVLIAYSTAEGHSRKIAEFMASALAEEGYGADVVDVGSERAAAVQPVYRSAIVGGSVHMGRHSGDLGRFLRDNATWLSAIPLAFFSVSLTAARDDERSRAEAAQVAAGFLAGTGLTAARSCRIAGALHFGEYGPVKRLLARSVAQAMGAPPAQDVEYTDWKGVHRFAVDFVCEYAGAPREVA